MGKMLKIKIPAFEIEITEEDSTENIDDDSTDTTDQDSNNDTTTTNNETTKEPDFIDNRNSNGDVTLPYRYQKNGWDILYDLDEEERVATGRFLIRIKVNATPTGNPPETKLVLENLLLDGKKKFNIYDSSKNTYLAIGSETILDLKQNFNDRKYQYSVGDWGDNSYIYLFLAEICSGVFYLFPKDTNAGYVRI